MRRDITQYSPAPSDVQEIREIAVAEHEKDALTFVQLYRQMEREHLAAAFSYGRKRLDASLYAALHELPRGSRVLDIGCGTGEQLKQCREQGFKVTGIEPSGKMRAIARRNNPGILIQDGSITALPFRDATFDFVMAIEVLRYLHQMDIEQAYYEMLRVLKPGACCFFTMVNRYALDGFYVFHCLKRWIYGLRGERIAHCEFVTPAEVRRDLERLGAQEVRTDGRMLAPLRIVYKGGASLGAAVARRVEAYDDAVSAQTWLVPFAGHLVVIAKRPSAMMRASRRTAPDSFLIS